MFGVVDSNTALYSVMFDQTVHTAGGLAHGEIFLNSKSEHVIIVCLNASQSQNTKRNNTNSDSFTQTQTETGVQPTICYCNLSLPLFLTLLHCKAAIRQSCKLTFAYRHSLAHLYAQAAELVGGAVFCLAGGKRSLGLRALKAQMSGSVGAWRCDHTALNAKRHIV